MSSVDALVLATINAPYSKKLDAIGLANCIADPGMAKLYPGPLSSFFYELKAPIQMAFVQEHGITLSALSAAARVFDNWSGRKSPASSLALAA